MLDIDRVVKVGELFSLYGELLTDKQQEFVKLYYFNDLSLGEIADQKDISRQAVYDNLQRSEETLKKYEQKLGLAAHYELIETEINNLIKVIDDIRPKLDSAEINRLEEIITRLETYHEGEL